MIRIGQPHYGGKCRDPIYISFQHIRNLLDSISQPITNNGTQTQKFMLGNKTSTYFRKPLIRTNQ